MTGTPIPCSAREHRQNGGAKLHLELFKAFENLPPLIDPNLLAGFAKIATPKISIPVTSPGLADAVRLTAAATAVNGIQASLTALTAGMTEQIAATLGSAQWVTSELQASFAEIASEAGRHSAPDEPANPAAVEGAPADLAQALAAEEEVAAAEDPDTKRIGGTWGAAHRAALTGLAWSVGIFVGLQQSLITRGLDKVEATNAAAAVAATFLAWWLVTVKVTPKD